MKHVRSLVVYCTALAVLLAPFPIVRAGEARPLPKDADAKASVFYDPRFDVARPEKVIEALRQTAEKRDLNFEETFDQGTAWFLQQRWDRAAACYESAAARAADRGRKAVAWHFAAQSAANGQHWAEAGALANKANQQVPESKDLAGARLAFWLKADNHLESKVAEDRIAQLELKVQGRETALDPATIIIIVVVVATTTVVITGAIKDWTPEKIEDLLRAMGEAAGRILAAPIDAAGGVVDRALWGPGRRSPAPR